MFPIPMNFVVGAAVGAATTYVFKDDSAKQWLSETGGKLKEGSSSFIASFKKKPEEQAEDVVETVEAVAESAAESVETAAETVVEKSEETQQRI
ncbi:MAG: Unknown protein [uncultured Thiotrichaceae bacterium]|uniref:YtxH domain-containing protein n=1 Tax=uncultured Thiotrichaceae bacterium TaxID=298394 RepID=A0A6S6SS11_9GAMM|nr:MAG: Unknown protein [uncultured Thiotrichaceae bacterium]